MAKMEPIEVELKITPALEKFVIDIMRKEISRILTEAIQKDAPIREVIKQLR